MQNTGKTANTIRWIARIWGSAILIFLTFFLVAALFFEGEAQGEGLESTKELIAFIFFPVSTVIGLAIAYKWEGTGGLIACLGLVIGPIVTWQFPNKAEDLMFVAMVYPPGFLYLIYWFITRKKGQVA